MDGFFVVGSLVPVRDAGGASAYGYWHGVVLLVVPTSTTASQGD